MSRAEPALPAPGALGGFPRWRLTTRRALKRGHRTKRGAWWFASSGSGRFDLPEPQGTCYLTLDTPTAIREAVGKRLTALGVIDYGFAAERCVSSLHVPRSHALADAFDASECAGIRYRTRFTTGAAPNAVALFGQAGEQPWPADDAPLPFAAAALTLGFRVSSRPRSVRIVATP
ncbi:MAG: RES domain-containing protein [Mycobacteriaceae bacterium]